jgi:hypothetical protein
MISKTVKRHRGSSVGVSPESVPVDTFLEMPGNQKQYCRKADFAGTTG